MLNNIKGHVLVVMAPTGSGKGTVIDAALEKFPDLYETVSCTTREPRPGEIDGRDYYFVTKEEFQQKVEAGEFLEWATFGKNQYGTLKSEIINRLEEGKMLIVEIDLQGVEQLKDLIPKEHITVAYIDAGSWDKLKERVLKRAPIAEDELKARQERYVIEVLAKDRADVVIDNTTNDPKSAISDFLRLVESLRDRVGQI